MPVVVQVKTDRFRDLLGRFARIQDPSARQHALEHAQEAGRILARAMAEEAPRGHPDPLGRPPPEGYQKLCESFRQEVKEIRNGFQIIITMAPQGIYVLRGTRPHPIPRGGSAEQIAKGYPLHFFWARTNQEVWFWSVNHPGTQPNRFDLRAIEKTEGQVIHEAQRGAVRAFVEPINEFFKEKGDSL